MDMLKLYGKDDLLKCFVRDKAALRQECVPADEAKLMVITTTLDWL